MGTNYYVYRNACEHCGRGDEPLHIGKSSAGWCFALHVGREEWDETPRSLDEWRAKWSEPGAVIRDEYGRTLTADEMLSRILGRSWSGPGPTNAEWLRQNHAQPGPNGLARHRLDSRCVGHGDGTYDLVTGEFS